MLLCNIHGVNKQKRTVRSVPVCVFSRLCMMQSDSKQGAGDGTSDLEPRLKFSTEQVLGCDSNMCHLFCSVLFY